MKTRHMNEVFVEMFDTDLVTLPVEVPRWLAVRDTTRTCRLRTLPFLMAILLTCLVRCPLLLADRCNSGWRRCVPGVHKGPAALCRLHILGEEEHL